MAVSLRKRLVLNVGAGPRSIELPPGYQDGTWQEIRLDANAANHPDLVANAWSIPRTDSSVDAVYCSHTLEHLPFHLHQKTLVEFRRVLVPGGFAVVVCPDLVSVCRLLVTLGTDFVAIQTDAGPVTPLDMLFGHRASVARGQSLMAHQSGFTETSLAQALRDAGFERVSCGVGTMYDLYGVGYASAMSSVRSGSHDDGQHGDALSPRDMCVP